MNLFLKILKRKFIQTNLRGYVNHAKHVLISKEYLIILINLSIATHDKEHF